MHNKKIHSDLLKPNALIKQYSRKLFFLSLLTIFSGILGQLSAHSDSNSACSQSDDNKANCHKIIEYPLNWQGTVKGQTHEITYNHNGGKELWISGDLMDAIARVSLDGKAKFFLMPTGSTPHGLAFDAKGHLWVTLQDFGSIVRVSRDGEILESIDVRLKVEGLPEPLNTGPHGLCVAQDGETLWFTGKYTSTVGKINPDRTVEQFVLPTPNAEPIYVSPGPNNFIWCTELLGNNIARISQNGQIVEFPIPTAHSRPIVITPSPDNKTMWFSEEAGNNVARITQNGKITEFPVPLSQANTILAGLTFDNKGNLWTESYINEDDPCPPGFDHLVKFDKAINHAKDGDISCIPITYYEVETPNAILHRIILGPDNNLWFTELSTDKVGKLILKKKK